MRGIFSTLFAEKCGNDETKQTANEVKDEQYKRQRRRTFKITTSKIREKRYFESKGSISSRFYAHRSQKCKKLTA
jgi:hypothetical protein